MLVSFGDKHNGLSVWRMKDGTYLIETRQYKISHIPRPTPDNPDNYDEKNEIIDKRKLIIDPTEKIVDNPELLHLDFDSELDMFLTHILPQTTDVLKSLAKIHYCHLYSRFYELFDFDKDSLTQFHKMTKCPRFSFYPLIPLRCSPSRRILLTCLSSTETQAAFVGDLFTIDENGEIIFNPEEDREPILYLLKHYLAPYSYIFPANCAPFRIHSKAYERALNGT